MPHGHGGNQGFFGGGDAPKDSEKGARKAASGIDRRRAELAGRSDSLFSLFSSALFDPVGGAGKFLGFFERAMQASLQPQFEEFDRRQDKTGANVARRFGGNASSVEVTALNLGSDRFQDFVSRQAAQLGPQALQAQFTQTAQLGNASNAASSQEATMLQMLLQALGLQGDDSGGFNFGQALGALGGAGVGFLAGGPPGAAAGASVGASAFG